MRRYPYKIGDKVKFKDDNIHFILTIIAIYWETGPCGMCLVEHKSFISYCAIDAIKWA